MESNDRSNRVHDPTSHIILRIIFSESQIIPISAIKSNCIFRQECNSETDPHIRHEGPSITRESTGLSQALIYDVCYLEHYYHQR